jgi:tetratricopeptide (TPR) repeat protein
MRTKVRSLLALSLGLFAGALSYARPIVPFAQDTKAGQSNQGQQGSAAQKGGQTGKPGQSTTQLPSGPSAEENQAYQAVNSEMAAGLDPDKVISLSEAFVQKYPNSTLLSYIYTFEASAYQQKGDAEKTVDAGEKSLKLKGDNLLALIIMSSILPQPQLMTGSEIDKQKKLTEAETDANQAIQLIDKLPKMLNEADDAYKKRKDGIASEPHSALGMIHLQRAMMGLTGPDQDELAKAVQEYKTSVEITDHPAPANYYRLGEVYEHENKIDDAIAAFSKASELSQGSALQVYADKQIEDLKKKQAQSKPSSPK